MPESRPKPVGSYQVLQDFVSPQASVRVIRMRGEANSIETHVHAKSAQIYVAIDGRIGIYRDGVEEVLEPYAALVVPAGRVHGARPLDGAAILINISVPPLAANDQSPLGITDHPADFRLPSTEAQVDD